MAIRTIYLTSPQDSLMGEALFHLYYHDEKLLDLIEHTGCPHNGGQHTLSIRGREEEVISWLDLFLESYPFVKLEINTIKEVILITNDKVIRLGNLYRRDRNKKKVKWFRVDKYIDEFRIHGDYRIEPWNIENIPDEYLQTVIPQFKMSYLLSMKHNEK